jgi:oligopeptidase B
MSNNSRIAGLTFLLIFLLPAAAHAADDGRVGNEKVTPPVAKIIPHDVSAHGDPRTDNYYWLRDDTRKKPEVIGYLEAEKSYADAALAHTSALQDILYRELIGNIERNEADVPTLSNGYWYYTRYQEGQEYPIHARRKGNMEAAEEVLLDMNELAQGQDYIHLGSHVISPDNRYMAYAIDTQGRGFYDIAFIDLKSGNKIDAVIRQAEAQLVWANDNQTLFYIKQDSETLLGNQVFRHRVGTPHSKDVLVYRENNAALYINLHKSQDSTTIYLGHEETTHTGVSILSASNPNGRFKPFYALEENHQYALSKSGDDYFVLTNWQAKNFRLMKTKEATSTDRTSWIEVVAHRENVLIQAVHTLHAYIVLLEREQGVSRIRVINRSTGADYLLKFDDPVFFASIGQDSTDSTIIRYNLDPEATSLRVAYSSMTTPWTLYEFNLENGTRKLLKQTQLERAFDPSKYKSERLLVEARDGTQVPVSLVYRKDLFGKDGSNPLYQYGYGAYGLNQEPEFWPAITSLLNRGFVYAIAHVRGGGMMGPQWYDDGRVLKKKNSFHDFVDVTLALVERGYADGEKVFASGASAGGTLTAAVAIAEPELYRGVVIGVPFVDVVTSMLDESIPLVTNEFEEWGNPKIKEHYDYMLSYSPYDQILARDYTSMLVTTGLYDSQVQYYEPAKFVAKLRALKTDDNLLLFPIDMASGHGGASGRYKLQRSYAFEFAFILDTLGISE